VWDRLGGLRQQQSIEQQQTATIEAISRAVANHAGKIHQQQTTALRALQQAVSAQVERAHRTADKIRYMPLNDM
jgi:hypothetical protein